MSTASMSKTIFSISHAARELGAPRKVLSVLIRVHGIPTASLSSNARAKGLTLAAFRRLRRAWDEYQRGTQQT